MDVKKIQIADFNYELPEEKIAKYPLPKRDESKLLIYKNEEIAEDRYFNLAHHLPDNTFLIFNNTKVVEARLLFKKNTGSMIEIFCLEPDEMYADITTAMATKTKVLWKCLVGGAKKWKEELLIKEIDLKHQTQLVFEKANGSLITLTAKKIKKTNEYFLIEFNWNNEHLSFAEILHYAGIIPLPPYLQRDAEVKDKETYQTIYAKYDGSVAAPTAGLHFTGSLFASLATKNILPHYVTLHVGAGTFKPVKTETIEHHEMHAEFIDVSIEFIQQLIETIQQQRKIVCVGTTSLRTIETLYWMGVKLSQWSMVNGQWPKKIDDISIHQWDVYQMQSEISAIDALRILSGWMKENKVHRLITKTQIIITSHYQLKIADGIVTNFHQPQSTLLLLISSFVGEQWKKIYNYALENDFRFLSYGDGCLLWKH
ncbi:MAG: S-adenosylmethionine:tRNA ribosyltransferase-isomerase [Sphingobacteriia bacterium]|nr:S-adenosylmethionine:tRNA ribosyltransferase-isomerase [Sphingobacteriia bacterium]